MKCAAVLLLLATVLCFLNQVATSNLEKAIAPSMHFSKKLIEFKKTNCKQIKCPIKEEPICVKLKNKKGYSPKNIHIIVINKCEIEYIKCYDGLEAIPVPMENCVHKNAGENHKLPGKKRGKRSLDIATKSSYNINHVKQSRKHLSSLNKTPNKINYRSLYFGPIRRYAFDQSEDEEDLTWEQDRVKSDDEEYFNHKLHSADGDKETKDIISFKIDDYKDPIVNNNEDEYIVGSTELNKDKSENADELRNVEDASEEQEKELKHRQNKQVENEEITLDEEDKLDNTAEETDNIKVQIKPLDENEYNQNSDKDLEETPPSLDQTEENKQDVTGDDDLPEDALHNDEFAENNDKEIAKSTEKIKVKVIYYPDRHNNVTENTNGIEKYNDDQTYEETGAIDDNLSTDKVITEDGSEKGVEENDEDQDARAIENNSSTDEVIQANEDKNQGEKFAEAVSASTEQVKEEEDEVKKNLSTVQDETGAYRREEVIYDDVDIDQYKRDCPSVCPARDVMLCARCKEGIYRTFMSACHLRMFNCRHPEEKLELVSRKPCILSAPFLNEMKTEGRVGEPGDEDRVLRYIRCREKGDSDDPRCNNRKTKTNID